MKIDIQPTLVGRSITLRPLLKEDFSALYLAASDPVIWEIHPDSSRYKQNIFKERFFEGAIASGGAFAVIDTASIVWFGVGEINHRSRKAVEKLGATLTRKEERELDGKPYTQMYYKLTASGYCA